LQPNFFFSKWQKLATKKISAWPLRSLDIYLVSSRCAGQIEQLEDVWLDFQAA
jgi:hypothetical protein